LPDERTRGMTVLVLLPAQGSSGGTCGEIPSLRHSTNTVACVPVCGAG
jgi:hypothetical protein